MISRAAPVLDYYLKFLDKVLPRIIMTSIKSTLDRFMHKCFDTFIRQKSSNTGNLSNVEK